MSKNRQSGYFVGRRPRVIGHRGAAGEAPENTEISFALAEDQGADILETDVRLSADGVLIVGHDETVDRTTNGSGRVIDLTLAQLKQLDAGYWFTADGGKTYPFRGKGVTIMTWDEFLIRFTRLPVNVEVKDNLDLAVQLMVSALRKHGRLHDVLVAGCPHSLVKRIRRADPNVVSGFSRPEIVRFLARAALGLTYRYKGGPQAIQLPVTTWYGIPVTTPRVVKLARKLGVEVHPWTINDEAELRRLLAMGVDGIFTDFPGRLRKIIDNG